MPATQLNQATPFRHNDTLATATVHFARTLQMDR
jgi:hypothetical protein